MKKIKGQKEKGIAPIILGITGHRDLRKEDILHIERKINEIFEKLIDSYPNSPFILLSPLAEGADRLAAKIALEKGIGLIAPLPFPEEEYKTDFSSEESICEFEQLLNAAQHHFSLPAIDGDKLDGINKHIKQRSLYYEQVGVYVARHCQILIALWDGVELESVGGTSQIVRFMMEGLPDSYVSQKNILDPLETGVVYQIVTPREKNILPNGIPFEVKKLYPTTDKGGRSAKDISAIVLSDIDNFNNDYLKLNKKLHGKIRSSENNFISEENGFSLPAHIQSLIHYQAISDAMAGYYQKLSRRTLIILFAMMVGAVFSFNAYLNRFSLPFLMFLYPTILGAAFLLYRFAEKRNYHNKYIDYRAIAEAVRIQIFWRLAGLNDDVSNYYLRKQKSDMNWTRCAIRALNISSGIAAAPSWEPTKYLKIVIDCWVTNQRDWLAKTSQKEDEKLRKMGAIAKYIYLLGFVLALLRLAIYYSGNNSKLYYFCIVVFVTTTLAIAAAIKGYIEKMAFSEHVNEYKRIKDIYSRAAELLQVAIRDNDQKKTELIIVDLGKEALRENGDWVLLHRARQLPVPR